MNSKRKFLMICFLAATLMGCSKEASSIKFVVSNLSVAKDGSSEYSSSFKGSATLSSSAPSLKGKTVIVIIKAKTMTGNEEGVAEQYVTVTDGVGKIDIFEFNSNPNSPTPKFSDWKTLGYWELSPATIEYK